MQYANFSDLLVFVFLYTLLLTFHAPVALYKLLFIYFFFYVNGEVKLASNGIKEQYLEIQPRVLLSIILSTLLS